MAFDCVLGAWQAHEQELHGFLLRRLGDAFVADDLLQEILLKAMRQGQAFCVLDNPRAWLFQVARNALIDYHRAHRPTVSLPEDLPDTEVEPDPVDELTACLERNLARLGAEDREILRACDLRGVHQHTFAAQHGLTLPAAKSRLQRARKRLRQALVDNCQVRFDETGRVCCFSPPANGDFSS